MRGAVAAGHPLTAEAGARLLTEGGNAFDACIAAAFASWVVEGPLSGPGGGGFLLAHRAGHQSARLLDFFVAAPGIGAATPPAPMETIEVDFDGETSQAFRIGSASCAVPGSAAGLAAAHRAYASLPWGVLLEPAIELARRGYEVTAAQAYLHEVLDCILRHTDEGRRVYGHDGGPFRKGELVVSPNLADTLETIADGGADAIYRGELGAALVQHLAETGGSVTAQDLEAYRPVWRRPVTVPYRGRDIVSNPPPSAGGVLIAYGLRLLDELAPAEAEPGSSEEIARLAAVMGEQLRARAEPTFARSLYRGGLARRLCSDESVRDGVRRIGSSIPAPAAAAPRGTTHISVVDAAGNAASLSSSIGSGSGMVVPGTGIHLNNMLGEADLQASPGATRPGRRLTSMMAPSIVLETRRPRLVVGSAGSARLRGAIMQIIVNVVGHGLPVHEAIARPRIHAEGDRVHCEGGFAAEELDVLERLGLDVVRWRRRNLFFGGAAAVELREDGTLAAAGDPRRGGHGVVVK